MAKPLEKKVSLMNLGTEKSQNSFYLQPSVGKRKTCIKEGERGHETGLELQI